ncbi:MAG: NUDIX hydrolase [candidate division Zixibacteria bacterium]|nr:NUDIX hydrolase [candidate division Zixibacteria bacterium]
MNDKHKNFDAEKLNRRKDRFSGYRYCPYCGKTLKEEHLDGQTRLACGEQDCDFVFYQNPIPAAGAVIVEDDRILMVKRAHPPRIGWWCFPAGFMEWREHPTQTAVREVREETGLEVKLTSFFEVYSGTDDPRNNAVLMLYLAEVVGGELKAADDALEVAWFSFDNLPEKIAFESHIQALADYQERFR